MARKKFGILHQNTKIRQKCLEYDFFPSQNTYFCWSWVRFLFSRGCRSFNNPTTFFMSGHSSHVWLMPRSHLRVHWCLTEHPDYTHLIPSLLNVGGWDRDRLALSRGATFHAWGNYQPSCVSHCFSIILWHTDICMSLTVDLTIWVCTDAWPCLRHCTARLYKHSLSLLTQYH